MTQYTLSFPGTYLARHALISRCGHYRYRLERRVCFVMLNPSTADGLTDDPTTRRCMNYAQEAGFAVLDLVNLFALRSPSPKSLLDAADPIGPDTDERLYATARLSDTIIAAWGTHGGLHERDEVVLRALRDIREVHCLGTTKHGFPRHPLYVKSPWQLTPYHGRTTP